MIPQEQIDQIRTESLHERLLRCKRILADEGLVGSPPPVILTITLSDAIDFVEACEGRAYDEGSAYP